MKNHLRTPVGVRTMHERLPYIGLALVHPEAFDVRREPGRRWKSQIQHQLIIDNGKLTTKNARKAYYTLLRIGMKFNNLELAEWEKLKPRKTRKMPHEKEHE
jgi:hypothetical protein